MPEISRFLGIVIRMYYRDHPPPHFHARYEDDEIVVEILTGRIEDRFPPRALRHVLEWWQAHRVELLADWERAHAGEPLLPIEPLE